MYNRLELEKYIKRAGVALEDLRSDLAISKAEFVSKLTAGDFTRGELRKLHEILHLTPHEFEATFFDSWKEHKGRYRAFSVSGHSYYYPVRYKPTFEEVVQLLRKSPLANSGGRVVLDLRALTFEEEDTGDTIDPYYADKESSYYDDDEEYYL